MKYDSYLGYDELTARISLLAHDYPSLVKVESAGKSYEGRDIWAITITNTATGSASRKPALYAEGNIHAGEVTASMTCLYLAEFLCQNFGRCPEVTHHLNTRAYYILPRVNPDGAEMYLTTPYMLRSSVRPYPDAELADLPGLHLRDVNGDGKILQMRVRDDKRGEWKVSPKDSRLLVRRLPGELSGSFYRVYPEGMLKDVDRQPFDIIRSPFGLDLNRNFPSNWDRSFEPGGDYPTSEPEVKAVVDFILGHKNIGAIQSFHTSGGFFFRNPYQYTEDKMDQDDLRSMKEIAREGTRVTGYPDVKSSNRSTLPEWAYEHLGIIGYTSELWDRLGQAGLNSVETIKTTDPEKWEEVQLKLLEWNDKELCGQGFYPWTKFQHPQLGIVEIGGWEPKYVVQNPPPHLLKQECHKNSLWAVKHAGSLPELEIGEVEVLKIDPDVYKITAWLHNNGYLPTSITNKGRQVAGLSPDKASIEGEELSILSGKATVDLGFLQGYMNGSISPAKSTAKACWSVRTAGTEVTITLSSDRAGCVSKIVRL